MFLANEKKEKSASNDKYNIYFSLNLGMSFKCFITPSLDAKLAVLWYFLGLGEEKIAIR